MEAGLDDEIFFVETFLKGLINLHIRNRIIELKPAGKVDCLDMVQKALASVVVKLRANTIRNPSLDGIVFASEAANQMLKSFLNPRKTKAIQASALPHLASISRNWSIHTSTTTVECAREHECDPGPHS